MKKLLILLTFISISPQIFADDTLIILGKVKSISLYKNSSKDNVKKNGHFFVVSNACGRYTAALEVADVIVGSYHKREILINGTIGEWCDPPITLSPDSYIIELRHTSKGYEERVTITLFDTEKGELAALPYMTSALGEGAIQPTDFFRGYSALYVSKAVTNEKFGSFMTNHGSKMKAMFYFTQWVFHIVSSKEQLSLASQSTFELKGAVTNAKQYHEHLSPTPFLLLCANKWGQMKHSVVIGQSLI